MSRGLLIVIEGPDKVGKSTQARILKEKLESLGYNVHLTGEPTKGVIGELIRRIVRRELSVDPRTLALLFAADRSEHVREIEEMLDRGFLVISDRYYHSSLVYQSVQGIDREWLLEINSFAPRPDLTIILLGERKGDDGSIFSKDEFQDRIRRGYEELVEELRRSGERIEVVDADRDIEKVSEEIFKLVEKLIEERRIKP